MSRRRRVGLFGGSFNPPHLAHLIVAEQVRDQFALDEVRWIPARRPPHKAGEALAEAAHRLAMTRLAVAANPAFAVSAVEFEREGPSYTVDTVAALQAAEPEVAFMLLLGGDSLAGLAAWHRPHDLLARVPLVVYPRPGASSLLLPDGLQGTVHTAEAPLLDLSGSAIRARCAAGRSIRYLVPTAVAEHIAAHGLYR